MAFQGLSGEFEGEEGDRAEEDWRYRSKDAGVCTCYKVL
jgi:hypothetical protein